MKVSLPGNESALRHIFRKDDGHILDTPENRQLLMDVANDASARLQSDMYGNVWAARELPENRQVWIRIRGTTIINAGINTVPRTFNFRTGLNRS